jgi:hypothetical protein
VFDEASDSDGEQPSGDYAHLEEHRAKIQAERQKSKSAQSESQFLVRENAVVPKTAPVVSAPQLAEKKTASKSNVMPAKPVPKTTKKSISNAIAQRTSTRKRTATKKHNDVPTIGKRKK